MSRSDVLRAIAAVTCLFCAASCTPDPAAATPKPTSTTPPASSSTSTAAPTAPERVSPPDTRDQLGRSSWSTPESGEDYSSPPPIAPKKTTDSAPIDTAPVKTSTAQAEPQKSVTPTTIDGGIPGVPGDCLCTRPPSDDTTTASTTS